MRKITETHTGKIVTDTDLMLEYLYVGDYGKENNIKASFLGYDKRIDSLVSANKWDSNRKIHGITLEEFVKDRTEKVLGDFVEKNIRDILAKRFAEILTDRSLN